MHLMCKDWTDGRIHCINVIIDCDPSVTIISPDEHSSDEDEKEGTQPCGKYI